MQRSETREANIYTKIVAESHRTETARVNQNRPCHGHDLGHFFALSECETLCADTRSSDRTAGLGLMRMVSLGGRRKQRP
jgi:hypothetical protein